MKMDDSCRSSNTSPEPSLLSIIIDLESQGSVGDEDGDTRRASLEAASTFKGADPAPPHRTPTPFTSFEIKPQLPLRPSRLSPPSLLKFCLVVIRKDPPSSGKGERATLRGARGVGGGGGGRKTEFPVKSRGKDARQPEASASLLGQNHQQLCLLSS